MCVRPCVCAFMCACVCVRVRVCVCASVSVCACACVHRYYTSRYSIYGRNALAYHQPPFPRFKGRRTLSWDVLKWLVSELGVSANKRSV